MPELPEVEAWVRELDPDVSRAPIELARPGHVATLKTFDPRPDALEGRRFAGAERRGKNLVLPTEDGELVLRVHLMSAGRLRYVPAGKKGPQRPMFQVRFADGGELVLTEAGKKKRAGVWLVTPGQLDEDLAHLGPDALEIDAQTLAPILARERRQLHPFLRDQRALELRIEGKGDSVVYCVHGHFGEPCPRCGEMLRRVDFEEHTITYCPAEQTGGRILKDRRLSRLLR